jgi:DNA-binding MarR family transcriptional regulator
MKEIRSAVIVTFVDSMNYFYYRNSINELRTLHGGDYSPELTYNSMLYLNIIAGTEDCTVSKLADMLLVSRSAVTIKVNELFKHGFVEKRQSSEDGRVWLIKLTPHLVDIYAMFHDLSAKTEAALLKKHTDSEMALFAQMLREVADFELEEVKSENNTKT